MDEKKSVDERRCLVRGRRGLGQVVPPGGTGTPSTLTYRALANILGSTESAMEDAFSPPPSAIRGVQPLPRDSDFSDDAEDAYMSGATGTITDSQRDEDYSDSPLSDDSPDALGAAAERLFARGQRISIGKDKDVRMAREMLGSGGAPGLAGTPASFQPTRTARGTRTTQLWSRRARVGWTLGRRRFDRGWSRSAPSTTGS